MIHEMIFNDSFNEFRWKRLQKTVPEDNDKLMIFVIVGRRTQAHCLRSEVGIASRSLSMAED